MDDEDGLHITPSFKSKSSKSKERPSPSVRTSAIELASDNGATGDDIDFDEGNSAVLKKSSKAKARGLGASSSSKKQASAGPAVASRSKLNLSFRGEDEDDPEVANHDELTTSIQTPGRRIGIDTSSKSQRVGTGSNYDAAFRLSSSLSQTSISNNLAATAQAGPSYSKDYLEELKNSTLAAPPSIKPGNGSDIIDGSNGYDSLTLSKFSNATVVDDVDDLETLLPTESAIASAKARRETARRLGVDSMSGPTASDFISLDVGMPIKNRESRLVREEDEIGEGEDDHSEYTGATERVALGTKGRAKERKDRKEGMREMIDEVMMEEEEGDLLGLQEDDEESKQWELAQIRRGEEGTRLDKLDDRLPYKSAPIPETTRIPTLSNTSSRLAVALGELQANKTENDLLLETCSREREALDEQEKELRQEVERVSNKYEWFLDFKTWVEEVATFLDEKVPKLEKIESDNLAIQRERTDMIRKRRELDDSDDVALFTGASIPTESQPEAEKGKDNEDMEVDDLGRARPAGDLEPRSFSRSNRRRDRQKRRLSRRSLQAVSAEDAEDGQSTDDDLLASDAQDLLSAGEVLVSSVDGLFSDVESEEFRNASLGIRPRFVDWKTRYGEEYANAFAGLAMVGVWEFWTRAEMASWNPFGVRELPSPPKSIDKFRWHEALSEYPHPEEDSIESGRRAAERAEPQGDVVTAMVATVVLPRLRKLVQDGYDPYSAKATVQALGLVEEIACCIETSHPRFEHIVLTFLSRFQWCILRLQSIVLPFLSNIRSPLSGLDLEAIEARSRFAHRMYKLLSNGMRWRRYAKALVLPFGGEGDGLGAGGTWESCLVQELIAKTMLPVLEAGWETGGRELATKVTNLFPAAVVIPKDIMRRLQRN